MKNCASLFECTTTEQQTRSIGTTVWWYGIWQRNQSPVVSTIGCHTHSLRSGLVSRRGIVSVCRKQSLHNWSKLSTEAMHVVGAV